MTKKEYILQYVTIGVSLLAVFASVFAGWMAYNASISSAEVGGKLDKENEIESRVYLQKYELYKEFLGAFSKVINDSDINKNYYLEKGKKLEKLLIQYGPSIRTMASDDLIKKYSCVYKKVQDLIIEEQNEEKCSPNQARDECENPKWERFSTNIIGGIYLLENEVRKDLGGNELPELYIQDHGGWNPSFECTKEEQYIYGDFYLQNN